MRNHFMPALVLLLSATPLCQGCDESSSSSTENASEAYCRSLEPSQCLANPALCDAAWCEGQNTPNPPAKCAALSNEQACNDLECADNCDCSVFSNEACLNYPACIANNKCDSADPCANYQHCEVGERQCNGGTENIIECVQTSNGCTKWNAGKAIIKCADTPDTPYCANGECVATKNICLPSNGSKASVLKITDGDTFRLLVTTGKANCIPSVHSVRIHGIDAPECEKVQGDDGYFTCTQSTQYGYYKNAEGFYVTNDPYGYEAMLEAEKIAPVGTEVTLSCDAHESDGGCEIDNTENRRLVYMGIPSSASTTDFSTEMAARGAAFANTKFYNTTSKIKAICSAMGNAQKAKKGMWGTKSTVKKVINAVYGKSWLDSMQRKCGL